MSEVYSQGQQERFSNGQRMSSVVGQKPGSENIDQFQDPMIDHQKLIQLRTNSATLEGQEDEQKLDVDPWRWINLFSLFIAMLAHNSLGASFTSISQVIAGAYGVSTLLVNTTGIVFYVAFVIFNFPSIMALESGSHGTGLMISLKISIGATIIAAWVRYLVIAYSDNFAVIIIPTSIIAILHPFVINSMSKVGCMWFPVSERAVAISILSLTLPIGAVLGISFSSSYVTNDDQYNFVALKAHLAAYMKFQAILATCMCTPFLFVFRKKPKNFPSRSTKMSEQNRETFRQSVKANAAGLDMVGDIKKLFNNPNYLKLTFAFTVQYSAYLTCSTVMSNLTSPYGYTTGQISVIALSFVIMGVITAMIVSVLLDKYQLYNTSLRIAVFGTVFFTVFTYWTLPMGDFAIISINMGLLGACLLPMVSIGLSYCTEIAYPTSETLATGMMLLSAQIMGIGASYLGTYLIEAYSPLACVTMLLVQFSVAFLATLTVKQDLKRLQIDKEVNIDMEFQVDEDENK